ncbi:ABC transporter substrate-binding protein [Paenibacillus filicis]|uniref:ABC transporter substrate-binding protein n=1 Tax=Paenibacillus gyeongsangnamensis TaxID=3388067 RepID=A0ABT4QIF2_9BACL|nr:ABC transporter substrate-binding protein [Paenibacillus filicis]MCZ8516613.1 ABC transporter substrate-binding protein [Paenibacillus filicis]
MKNLKIGAVSRNYFNMPLWVTQHAGFFESEGLNVSIELYEPIDEVSQRLIDGRLDFAMGVTEHVILNNESGGRLQIIGGNVNRLPFSFIARPHIKNYVDLRGATIGVSSLDAGSSSLVMQILKSHGLDYPQDYTIKAVGPILTRWKMLQSGEIDAGLQGVPLNFIAIDAGYTDLGNPRKIFPDFQFTSLNVDSDWAERNSDTVITFLKAIIRAHEWFYTHKEESIDIAQKETGIDRIYAERAWDEYVNEQIFPRDATASPKAVQTLIDISALIRAIPVRSKTNAEEYIESRYIETARHELG